MLSKNCVAKVMRGKRREKMMRRKKEQKMIEIKK
jgi:hypothetical protein